MKQDKSLCYIHIGKCAGQSVLDQILRSGKIKKEYQKLVRIHIRKPPYSNDLDYLIAIRHPISRAISAFNWRYKLVVETKKQQYRFKNEHTILSHYKTLNNLSDLLYDSRTGAANQAAHEHFSSIHHLKENIAFYLSDLLDQIKPGQIYGVIKQHSIESDCKKLLASQNSVPRIHENNSSIEDDNKLKLSRQAESNLRRYLEKDYQCILKLWAIGAIETGDFIELVK